MRDYKYNRKVIKVIYKKTLYLDFILRNIFVKLVHSDLTVD